MTFGVYVHVPFCARLCDYCAFATWSDRSHLVEAYAAACVEEISSADLPAATSVFFGGGTPSLLPASLLVGILAAIRRAPGCEVTVECNPSSVSESLFASYRAEGVNRISLGAQSMASHVLTELSRDHSVVDVHAAAALAAGFPTWSVDLIYGSSTESDNDWRHTLDAVVALDPPHVSAYALTVEPGTPLAASPGRHPDDDVQAERYLLADRLLEGAGLENYEISNWAKPGHECRHNQLYWDQGDYRGIGCAAHSHQAGHRWWNVRTPDRYIDLISKGESVIADSETLDATTRRLEKLQLALRTRHGVPAESLPAPMDGLVARRGERVVLTPRGRLLANEVSTRLGG